MSLPTSEAQVAYLKEYHMARLAALREQRRHFLALVAGIDREIELLQTIAPSIDICYNVTDGQRKPGPSQTK